MVIIIRYSKICLYILESLRPLIRTNGRAPPWETRPQHFLLMFPDLPRSEDHICGWAHENDRFLKSRLVVILNSPRFQPLHYVTTHSPTLPSLYLRHSSFSTLPLLRLRRSSLSKPSFASPMSQDFHLRDLASRPWCGMSVPVIMIYNTQCKDHKM